MKTYYVIIAERDGLLSETWIVETVAELEQELTWIAMDSHWNLKAVMLVEDK